MKKTMLSLFAMLSIFFFACQKSNDQTDAVSLTPSATQVVVGEQMSVALAANANASNWTVTPSAAVTKAYGLTTGKVNYFTFNQPGVYTVSVQARSITYDSTAHQSLDSCWKRSGASHGHCTKGIDSASVAITVTSK